MRSVLGRRLVAAGLLERTKVLRMEMDMISDWLQWAYTGATAWLGWLLALASQAGSLLVYATGMAAIGRALVKYVRRADKVAGDVP